MNCVGAGPRAANGIESCQEARSPLPSVRDNRVNSPISAIRHLKFAAWTDLCESAQHYGLIGVSRCETPLFDCAADGKASRVGSAKLA